MLVDIVGRYGIFVSFKPQIETILLGNCSKQLLINELNRSKQHLYTDSVSQENKLQIYNLISRLNEELQNRTNQKAINEKRVDV